MEKSEARARPPAELLHRTPHSRVAGIVVDDQDLVLRPLDAAETPQRLDQQRRRFIVRRHMDGNKRFTLDPLPLGQQDPRQSRGDQLQSEHKDVRDKIGNDHARVQGREDQQQNRRSKKIGAQQ